MRHSTSTRSFIFILNPIYVFSHIVQSVWICHQSIHGNKSKNIHYILPRIMITQDRKFHSGFKFTLAKQSNLRFHSKPFTVFDQWSQISRLPKSLRRILMLSAGKQFPAYVYIMNGKVLGNERRCYQRNVCSHCLYLSKRDLTNRSHSFNSVMSSSQLFSIRGVSSRLFRLFIYETLYMHSSIMIVYVAFILLTKMMLYDDFVCDNLFQCMVMPLAAIDWYLQAIFTAVSSSIFIC